MRPNEFCLCGLWFVVSSVNAFNAHWPNSVLNKFKIGLIVV